MKRILSLASILAAACSLHAANVKLTDVHLCCGGCVKGAEKAVASISGAKAECDEDASSVTVSAPDAATLQKAVDALTEAGYFGKSSDAAIKLKPAEAKNEKVSSLKISGLHLCCGKCVSSVNDTLKKVSGVKGTTAAKNAETFEITGDFNAKEAVEALNKAGLNGKVAK